MNINLAQKIAAVSLALVVCLNGLPAGNAYANRHVASQTLSARQGLPAELNDAITLETIQEMLGELNGTEIVGADPDNDVFLRIFTEKVWQDHDADVMPILMAGYGFQRLSLSLSPRLEQKLTLTIRPTLTIKLKDFFESLVEELMGLLEERGKKGRGGVIKTFVDKDLDWKFDYIVLQKSKDYLPGSTIDQAFDVCGYGFALYVKETKKWYLCVNGDILPEYQKLVAAHEFGERLFAGVPRLGRFMHPHYYATKLEIMLAEKYGLLRRYLKFITDTRPEKFADIYTVVNHADVFSLDDVFLRSEEEKFRTVWHYVFSQDTDDENYWPAQMRTKMKAGEDANTAILKIIEHGMLAAGKYAGQYPAPMVGKPNGSWKAHLDTIDKILRETMVRIYRCQQKQVCSKSFTRALWRSNIDTINEQLYRTWTSMKEERNVSSAYLIEDELTRVDLKVIGLEALMQRMGDWRLFEEVFKSHNPVMERGLGFVEALASEIERERTIIIAA